MPASGEPPVSTRSPTGRLIADLLAAGGTMRVPARPAEGNRDYRALVASAQRYGKVPPGKRVVVSQHGRELEIRLADALAGTLVRTSSRCPSRLDLAGLIELQPVFATTPTTMKSRVRSFCAQHGSLTRSPSRPNSRKWLSRSSKQRRISTDALSGRAATTGISRSRFAAIDTCFGSPRRRYRHGRAGNRNSGGACLTGAASR